MPAANAETMSLHLTAIGRKVAAGSHAALVLDGAGYHVAAALAIPENITLVRLPPYAPELNPIENVWEYLQPDEYETSEGQNFVFLPKRPAFTELLPIHSGYVGGSDFFGDFEDNDPRAYVYVEVPIEEQDIRVFFQDRSFQR
jgi:hypothetical protein